MTIGLSTGNTFAYRQGPDWNDDVPSVGTPLADPGSREAKIAELQRVGKEGSQEEFNAAALANEKDPDLKYLFRAAFTQRPDGKEIIQQHLRGYVEQHKLGHVDQAQRYCTQVFARLIPDKTDRDVHSKGYALPTGATDLSGLLDANSTAFEWHGMNEAVIPVTGRSTVPPDIQAGYVKAMLDQVPAYKQNDPLPKTHGLTMAAAGALARFGSTHDIADIVNKMEPSKLASLLKEGRYDFEPMTLPHRVGGHSATDYIFTTVRDKAEAENAPTKGNNEPKAETRQRAAFNALKDALDETGWGDEPIYRRHDKYELPEPSQIHPAFPPSWFNTQGVQIQ